MSKIVRRPPLLSPSATRWLACFALVAALQVWVHLQTRQVGYEIGRIREVALRLGQERRELEIEVATLTSPSVIDRAARERLGLRPAEEGQLVGLQ